MAIEMMCEKAEKTLKILYINRSWPKKWTWDALKKQLVAWRYRNWFHGQEGFFEVSLFSACQVYSRPLSWVFRNRNIIASSYDVLVINSKCMQGGYIGVENHVAWMKDIAIPKILFLPGAKAHLVPPDDILDKFDLVYKREMLGDLRAYPISPMNALKLRNTMLSCPIIPMHHNQNGRNPIFPDPRQEAEPYEHDIFFSGALRTNPNRQLVLERLQKESLDCFGGLQAQGNISGQLKTKPLKQRRHYMQAIRRSKINLALEGFGQFTYRHLEIWCLGGFCLSTPSIRDVSLPIAKPVEGVHYVAFDNLDDMVEKVRYYLTHDKDREVIAKAGRALFEQIYNPIKHGESIKEDLEYLVESFRNK